MKKKIVQKLTGIFIITLTVGCMALSGCSQPENADADARTETSSEAGRGNQNGEDIQANENAVFGKVTAIEGDAVTIALAEMPEREERPGGEAPGQERPDGEAAEGERPDADQEGTEEQPPELPEGAEPGDGEAPDGERPEGGGSMELALTGEEQTVNVTDATTYMINGEEGTLEDLQVDDIVTITLADDETAESIRSGMGMGRGETDGKTV